MSSLSDYLENKLLDHIFGNADYTAPGNIYVALFTADNGLEGGTLTGEIAAGGYSRVQLSDLDFGAAANGEISNVNDIEFPTATEDWGPIAYAALMDASAAGNVLVHGAFSVVKTVWNGDVFKVRAGDLKVSLS